MEYLYLIAMFASTISACFAQIDNKPREVITHFLIALLFFNLIYTS